MTDAVAFSGLEAACGYANHKHLKPYEVVINTCDATDRILDILATNQYIYASTYRQAACHLVDILIQPIEHAICEELEDSTRRPLCIYRLDVNMLNARLVEALREKQAMIDGITGASQESGSPLSSPDLDGDSATQSLT